ncbi:DNA-binding response regulator [Sporanaerobium hydrogeniformans]|uniref:DNA-binding response regulator n=1 Tax=Sporanaerobium hydrogeniformans TaxID=3072179 RepID=A0AC61DD30_9FIRM|nr:response regulator transcription factor [Sporanaerobium hydrogeniformans]PHV70457.1 DNA-binding response regulator [Sporanaerobium hydrogeniformans]
MKLLIVDDHEIVRKGLIASLAIEQLFDEIDEADSIEKGMKSLILNKPDMTIVDINLGNKENGLTLIEKAKEKKLITQFIVLTSSSRVGDFLRAKTLEVEGYILKDSDMEDIIYGIRSVIRGRKFYDAQIEIQVEQHKDPLKEKLTEREYEVLVELGKGLTNGQIAETLFITENTVKKHISNLMSKLELAHRTEVALFAAKRWRRVEDQLVKK